MILKLFNRHKKFDYTIFNKFNFIILRLGEKK